MDVRERIWVLAWMVAVVALCAAPAVVLFNETSRVGQDLTYIWVLPPYPEDGLSYLAWVKQAAEGALLFHVKFTQLDHAAAVFSPPFLAIGWLSALTGWSSGFASFVARLVFVVAFLGVLERFSRQFDLARGERWTFLALVSFSSGLGFLFDRQGFAPPDRWMPEINTLWSLAWNPVFAAALALMLAVLLLVERATRAGADPARLPGAGDRSFLVAGALTGLLAFVHPYDVVPVVVVVGCVALYRLRGGAMGRLLRFALVAAPPCALQLWLSRTHPVLSAHGAEGAMLSPSPLAIAVALGIPGILAVYGIVRARAEGRLPRLVTIVVWVVAALALAYAPVWFQRRLVMGIHIPICLLAAIGAWHLVRRASEVRGLRVALVALLVVLTTPTHVANFREARRQGLRDASAYYVPAALRAALTFLDEEVPSKAVVLAHYYVARLIPGFTGNAVTLGHWAQSVEGESHLRWLRQLFAPGSLAEKRAMLRDSRIEYVFVEPGMRQHWLGGQEPAWLAEVGTPVYDRDEIRIVRIDRGRAPSRAGGRRPGAD